MLFGEILKRAQEIEANDRVWTDLTGHDPLAGKTLCRNGKVMDEGVLDWSEEHREVCSDCDTDWFLYRLRLEENE